MADKKFFYKWLQVVQVAMERQWVKQYKKSK